MNRLRPLPVDLRGLILFFVLLSVLATLGSSFVVAYRVQRDALIQSALAANSAYAAKVASSIDAFLRSAQGRLKYSADVLAMHWNDPTLLRTETDRLQRQGADFNSIAIVDASGKVLQAAPAMLRIQNVTLRPGDMQQLLLEHTPRISSAYIAVSGQLVVFISQPVISPTGQFLGVLGGSVYLLQQSALHTIISNHFHDEGTFVSITDANRRLLYHPDRKRIGEILALSKPVDAALQGGNGAMAAADANGVAMLSGYAQVPDARWAVVAQQPRERALAALRPLMREMIVGVIPSGVLGFGLILAGALLIARPLQQLSVAANRLEAPETTERLLQVNAWYRDAWSIRQAMLAGVGLLQQKLGRLSREAQSDHLTGLANRRAMASLLDMLTQTGRSYSVLALDIDHFKRINDSFGHDVGDVALKHVAEILGKNCRASDLACRAGGEEFVLVMPDTSVAIAGNIAERIRESIADSDIPEVGRLTVSIGVACRDEAAPTPDAVLKLADDRLYLAKQSGRNQVVV